MSRSLKKGPYINVSLEKKILAMNESGKKNVLANGKDLILADLKSCDPKAFQFQKSLFKIHVLKIKRIENIIKKDAVVHKYLHYLSIQDAESVYHKNNGFARFFV